MNKRDIAIQHAILLGYETALNEIIEFINDNTDIDQLKNDVNRKVDEVKREIYNIQKAVKKNDNDGDN